MDSKKAWATRPPLDPEGKVSEMTLPESAITMAAVIFAVRFIALEAGFERSSRRGDATIFRPVFGLRLVFGIGIPGFLYGASQLLKSSQRSDVPLALIVFIGGALILFLIWPGTVLVDPTAIQETKWFGLRHKRILWNDVAFAGGDGENNVAVRSKDGRVIRHSPYHVDRAGFIAVLKQYCENCSYNYAASKPWAPIG